MKRGGSWRAECGTLEEPSRTFHREKWIMCRRWLSTRSFIRDCCPFALLFASEWRFCRHSALVSSLLVFFFLVFLVFCFVLFLLFGSFMTWHGGHCSIEETAIGVVTAPIVTSPPFQLAINWNRSSYYCHYPRARVTLAVITDWIPPYFCHWYSPLITVMTVYGHFIRLLRFIYYWLNLRDMGAGSQMILYNLNRSQLPLWQLAMIIYSLPIGLNCWKYRVDGSEIETGRCYRHSFRQIQWHLNDISLVNRLYFEFSAGNICFVWISLLLSLNTVDILVDYDCNWWAGISLSVSRCGVCKLAL